MGWAALSVGVRIIRISAKRLDPTSDYARFGEVTPFLGQPVISWVGLAPEGRAGDVKSS